MLEPISGFDLILRNLMLNKVAGHDGIFEFIYRRYIEKNKTWLVHLSA